MSEHFFSLLLLDAQKPVNGGALAEQVRHVVAPLGLSVELIEETKDAKPALLMVGGVALSIGAVSSPVPTGTMDRAVSTSMAWPEAGNAVTAHKAHVIIGCINKPTDHQQAIHFAMVTTFVTGAALDLYDGLGAFWGSAELMLSPDGLRGAIRTMLAKQLPVEDWINLSWYRGERTEQGEALGAVSLGAHAFLGMEIEVQPAPQTPIEIAQCIFATLRYLLAHGNVLRDGDTIEQKKGEIALVRIFSENNRISLNILRE